MPEMDGLEFCRALRATDWGRSMYMIMQTGLEDEDRIVEAFEAGVDDYLVKPVSSRALGARMRAATHYVDLLEAWERDRAQLKRFAAELAISSRRMEHAALTDLLTSLPNRRAGMEALAKAWSGSSATVSLWRRWRSMSTTSSPSTIVTGTPWATWCCNKWRRDPYRRPQAGQREPRRRRGVPAGVPRCGTEDRLARRRATAPDGKGAEIHTAGLGIRLTVSIGVANREPDMVEPDQMVRAADRHSTRPRTPDAIGFASTSRARSTAPSAVHGRRVSVPAPFARSDRWSR